MRNLLTPTIKRQLRREYLLRVAVIGLIFFSVAVLLGIIAFMPSYLLSMSERRAVVSQAAVIEESLASREIQELSNDLHRSRTELELIAGLETGGVISDRLIALVESGSLGISLSSFSYTRGEGESTLIISGEADTRSDLLAFEGILDENPDYTSVILPVSNLVSERNISFSITLKGAF
jgi:hypothetical protein